MSHEIARTADHRAAMAFVGQTPWHGLGQKLTEGASMEEWIKAAGFDWDALQAVPSFQRADGSIGTFDSRRVIYRSDTGAPLSVMGDEYKIVQPREVLRFFQSLIDGGDFRLHTAGILNGGRRMWVLARNGHTGEVVKGDKVAQFLMLATSLDGSTPTVASFTAVRVVCANTIAEALFEAHKRAAESGLLNAISEHVDHEMGRTADSRLTSAWFGRGVDFKADALQALLNSLKKENHNAFK